MKKNDSAFKAVLKTIKKIAPYVICTALILLLVFLGVKYHTVIADLIKSQEARDSFVEWVKSKGAAGFFTFLAIQILQVIVAIIPGEPIELMAGALYGTWGGLIICQLGLLLGSICVYGTVKLAGAKSVPESTLAKYKFLRDEAHVKFALFMLYFIPGTPKDMLLYIGPFIPVSAKTFFALSTIARIPSVLTSTYMGAHLMRGDIKSSVITAVITGAAALICIFNQERIISAIQKIKK